MSLEFYDELLKNGCFCESLGRLILISGKLESALKQVVLKESVQVKYTLDKATLGQLINTFKKYNLMAGELNEVLSFIVERRNYLTHNLYPIFNDEIDVSLLPKEKLEPEDAKYYFPRCVEDLLSYVKYSIDYINERI